MRTPIGVAISLLFFAALPVAYLCSVGVRMLGAGAFIQVGAFVATLCAFGYGGIKAIDSLGEKIEPLKPPKP